MLTVPWFVTSTIRDLCRWGTTPRQRVEAPPVERPEEKSSAPAAAVEEVEKKKINAQNTSAVKAAPNTTTTGATSSTVPQPTRVAGKTPVPEKVESAQAKVTPNLSAVKNTIEPRLEAKKEPALILSHQPPVDSATKTSYKSLVLTPSASGGKMSIEWAKEQVEKFKFDFDDADKDKSGSLSFNEVYQVLQKVGFKGSEQEAQVIFGHLDRDSDKKVTRQEFEASLKNLPRLTIKEFCLRKAFLQLDKDKSGYLTREEIEDATKKSAGLDIAAEKIADLLVYLCKEDKDQKVSYEEFLRVFGVQQEATVMRQVFSKLDADKSGFLSKEEILAAVKSEFELKLRASKISDLLCYWCKDEDKKISYEEFVNVWTKQEAPK